MITLVGGPVAGIYEVKRAPLFLRGVVDTVTKEIDVLNELADEPKPTEKVFVYKRQGEVTPVHLNFGGGKGGFYAMAEYRFLDDIDGELFRATEPWRTWCIANTKGSVDHELGVITNIICSVDNKLCDRELKACCSCSRNPSQLTKALSGYAEWFWLMAKNWKDAENRPWPLSRFVKPEQLPYRFYLHASKTPAKNDDLNFIETLLIQQDVDRLTEFLLVDWSKYRGCIIGEITAVREIEPGDSPWAFGPHVFSVKDGVLYDNPIPCRGQLGFFDAPVGIGRRETHAT